MWPGRQDKSRCPLGLVQAWHEIDPGSLGGR
jgi:hypothetical protein